MPAEAKVNEGNLQKISEQKGGSTVNKVLQNELSRLLSKDASVDLQQWLDKSISSYAINRSKAIDYALRRSLATPPSSGTDHRPSLPRFLATAVPSISTLRVVQEIHSTVQQWATENCLNGFHEATSEKLLLGALSDKEVMADLPSSTVISLTPDLVIKVAPLSTIRYLPTFEYIVRNAPQIQVADHLGVLTAESRAYIFMRKVPGASLDKFWTDLSHSQKKSIMEQLENPFRLLRAIPRPSSDHPLGTGSPAVCIDTRRYSRVAKAAIHNEGDFNQFLVTKSDGSNIASGDMTLSFMKDDHEIVLTHSDLHPRNIMVTQDADNGEIKVEALIDWELCGWYPVYWEYVKALNTISHVNGTLDWYKYLPINTIGMWGNEFAIDQIIDRRL